MFGEPTRMGTNYAHFNNISMQLPQAGGPLAPTLLERSISDTLPRDSNFGWVAAPCCGWPAGGCMPNLAFQLARTCHGQPVGSCVSTGGAAWCGEAGA